MGSERNGAPGVLRAEALDKRLGGREILRRVTVAVRAGEVVGLLGPNGAGKTTTFYMIVGLMRPDGGRILLNDVDITREPMFRRARLGVSYLPQEPSVFRKLTVEENLLAILETLPLSHEERQERLAMLLEEHKRLLHLQNMLEELLQSAERGGT